MTEAEARDVATDILMHENDEKWPARRERIVNALIKADQEAYFRGRRDEWNSPNSARGYCSPQGDGHP